MHPLTPNPLQAHVGFWLRLVSNHVSHAFKLKVQAHGVTVAEWVVLRALFDADHANPSEIARTLGLTRGAISKLVDRLVSKHLVKCLVEEKDRRFQTLTLTPPGRKLVPLLAALADQNDAEFFGDLRPAERLDLMTLLKRIAQQRNLHEVPVD